VLESDVDEAARLLSSAMQTAAIDPRTGRVDMDLINTGRSAAQVCLFCSLVVVVVVVDLYCCVCVCVFFFFF
jgi:hypothetical protein